MILKTLMITCVSAVLALGLAGCAEGGGQELAGKFKDVAVEHAKEKISEAAEKVGQPSGTVDTDDDDSDLDDFGDL